MHSTDSTGTGKQASHGFIAHRLTDVAPEVLAYSEHGWVASKRILWNMYFKPGSRLPALYTKSKLSTRTGLANG